MTKNEISEGNNLIIDFCDYRNLPYFDLRTFEYHKRWEQLMPLVEEIESINEDFVVSVEIHKESCAIRISNKHKSSITSYNTSYELVNFKSSIKIQNVFRAVIEFIKWYKINYSPKMKTMSIFNGFNPIKLNIEKGQKVIHNIFGQEAWIESINERSQYVDIDYRNNRNQGKRLTFAKLVELNPNIKWEYKK